MRYQCPECGSHEIEVQARIWRRLVQEENGSLQTVDSDADGSEEWDRNSLASCGECQHGATMAHFEVAGATAPRSR